MSSASRRTLPARPDLDQQRTLAKELLRAVRADDPDAIARVRAQLPDKQELSLADAQFVLAREYGFASWRALAEHIAEHIAERTGDARPPVERFKRAVHDGDAATVRALLERHAEVRASVNAPIFSFDAPALVAVSDRHVDVIDALLAFGADPNRRSRWWAGGFHPLHGARGAAAERLLAAGAVPDACALANLDRPDLLAAMLAEDPARAHERGGDGQTPLHFARSREVVDLLLAAGADVDARDVDHRSTPAQWMLGTGAGTRVELARYLVDRGAAVDIFLAAALGLADRVRAMLEGDPSLLRLRTSQGEYGEKPPSSYHIYQWTLGANLSPLHVAVHYGRGEIVALMERFASPAERLLLACHRGDGEAARAVLAAHPSVMASLGPAERRALTDEAWLTNAPAVALMLELGFDPSVPGTSGAGGGTALHCAAWKGSVACVEVLLRHPAGRALVDVREPTFGGTPMRWCTHGAANCGDPRADHAAVARLLEEAQTGGA